MGAAQLNPAKISTARRSVGTVFTPDEARHIASNIAKLPDLLV
jgi:hypothetical protein